MSDPRHSLLDPSRCPLCGGDNGCAMAAEQATGETQPACWCVSASFSAALLARLPAGAIDAACICVRCVAEDAAARRHELPGA
jgi:hypothetical protein